MLISSGANAVFTRSQWTHTGCWSNATKVNWRISNHIRAISSKKNVAKGVVRSPILDYWRYDKSTKLLLRSMNIEWCCLLKVLRAEECTTVFISYGQSATSCLQNEPPRIVVWYFVQASSFHSGRTGRLHFVANCAIWLAVDTSLAIRFTVQFRG